ncbi:hypothetical protein ACWCOW_37175 [Streptomyces sp. NPDC001939]
MHTDLARAWRQWGKADQTVDALMAALRASPGEVVDGSSICGLVGEVAHRHPRTAGVRELVAATRPAAR